MDTTQADMNPFLTLAPIAAAAAITLAPTAGATDTRCDGTDVTHG